MKKASVLFAGLCLLASAVPALAHHESADAYLVFWKGIPPKTVAGPGAAASNADFWSRAFVSKYRILGAQVPQMRP
jgi:hypothetical protein